MEQKYNLKQKLIASVLVLGLFFQSCSNFSNSVVPRGTGEFEKEELSNQAVIKTKSISTKQLIGKEFTASGGYLVSFDQQEGNLQAGVKINAPTGFSKTYSKLPVIIAKDIDVRQLLQLSKEEQKRFVHFNRGKNGQVSRVLVYRPGLLGGGDTGHNSEKEAKATQDISKLSDIKDLRKHLYKGYLEITPKNYEQLIASTQKYEFLFMNYEGGVHVKGWEGASDISRLTDLLVLFSKVKKFKMNCGREEESELGEVIVRGIQFYEELKEVDLGDCQLNEVIVGDILQSIVSPEKLRVLGVSNNKLSAEMLASLQAQFPNAEVRSSLEGPSESSSEPSVKKQLSEVSIPASSREKGVERSKEVGKEQTYKKLVNGLPNITYVHQTLLEGINKIPMGESVKEGAMLYLSNIEQKVDDINRYQSKEAPQNFYYAMKGSLLEIHNTASLLYEFTKPYDHILSNKLKASILESIASFEKELNKRMAMSVEEKEALILKTKRLYAEQSYIARQGELQKTLMDHLGKIKQLLMESGKTSPCCYMSYAWPSKENQKEEYWVQPFLTILYDHLTAAGIRVIMDIRDNKLGDSIYQFMKSYKDGNHIILVGTESLLQKHYSPIFHAVQTELSIISNRPAQDQKVYGSSRTCPLLVSGSIRTSFPEIYDKYRTVRDAIDKGYASTLRCLLDWIYERQINKLEARYKNLWRDFDANYSGLPNEADDSQAIEEELNIGYHRQRLDYLQQDFQFQAVQAQEQTRHSSAVGAKMVSVLMESQGKNPKLLYNESGQQFQRPSITPDFIERQELWKKIIAHFGESEQQILTLSAHGLGGMGKTELAKYYYLCPPRPYTLRAWFNAEDRDLLYLQYVDLARANGIEYEKEMSMEEQVRRIKNWLEGQKDCLLVYDNVSEAKHLEGLLPENGKHHILITSRNEVEWPAHQKLDIDVMEEAEAIALICKITGCKEATLGLKVLVSTLHCLPLALAQAGAYIAEKKTSIEDYLKLYQKYQPRLMNVDTLARNPKHAPVWITFDMNFKALEEECPNALNTLKQASWLDDTVIPELLLRDMLKDTRDEPVDLLWPEAKRQIGRYSLMRIDSEGHELSMHRLLQDILRSQQDELESKGILNQIALSIKRIYPKDGKTMENIALVGLLLPHIEKALSHLKEFFNERECTDFNLALYLGNVYETIGNYAKAKEYFDYDLLVKQKNYIGNHSGVATSLGNLGRICNYLGEYQAAFKYYKQALVIRQALYKYNHPDIAGSFNNIGMVYKALGQNEEALKYLKQALAILQSWYRGNHPGIAALLNNIGNVYEALVRNQKALKYLEQALGMWQALYPGNHSDIASALNNIGMIYQNLGQNEAALKYYEQALAMRQSLYGGNHPDIASSLNNIGMGYQNLDQNEEALKYLKQALAMMQALYSGNHPDIASSFNNIGLIYKALGHLHKALKYHEASLAIRLSLYIDNHPGIASSLNNIGNVYKALGQLHEALKYYEQALAMDQALYSGNHPYIASSLSNIGNVYYSLGQNEEALKYYEQSLAILQSFYSDNHPEVANSLRKIGLIYYSLGQNQEALKYLKQALVMMQSLYSDNHPDIALSLNKIGNVYYSLGQNQEALKYLEQALAMMRTLYSGNHLDIAILLNNIGSVYQALGQNQAALKYSEQALVMWQALYTDKHPNIASSLNNLGNVYYSLCQFQKALKYYEQALEMWQALYTDKYPDIAGSFNNIGNVYYSLGQNQEALKYYERALAMSQALYSGNHPDVANSLNNIGLVYQALGHPQEALNYLKPALEMRQALYSGNHPDIAGSLNNIGMIHGALGEHQAALKYFTQALEMYQAVYPGDHPNICISLNNLGSVYQALGQL